MKIKKYRLVFAGKIKKGADVASIKVNLMSLLNANALQIDTLFNSDVSTIKSNLDYELALKYKDRFDKTGAICEIELLDNTNNPASTEHIDNNVIATDKKINISKASVQSTKLKQAIKLKRTIILSLFALMWTSIYVIVFYYIDLSDVEVTGIPFVSITSNIIIFNVIFLCTVLLFLYGTISAWKRYLIPLNSNKYIYKQNNGIHEYNKRLVKITPYISIVVSLIFIGRVAELMISSHSHNIHSNLTLILFVPPILILIKSLVVLYKRAISK